jgi:hypothetical protein
LEFINVNLILTLFLVAAAAWLINTSMPGSGRLKTVVTVALALIVVGILLWMVNTYVPMAGSIRVILNVVVFLAACVKVLQVFGVWDDIVRAWTGLVHRAER